MPNMIIALFVLAATSFAQHMTCSLDSGNSCGPRESTDTDGDSAAQFIQRGFKLGSTKVLHAASSVTPQLAGAAQACTVRNSNVVAFLAGDPSVACDTLSSAGWNISKSYNVFNPVLGDTDNADLFRAGSDCILSFHGADYHEFFMGGYVGNATAVAPVSSFYGVNVGFMTGLTEELEVILTEIRQQHGSLADFAGSCPGSLSVSGHSMGGGMAAIFAYLANLPSDPLSMGKHVSQTFLFGANPPATTKLENAQSEDGCFEGASYYARTTSVPGFSALGDPAIGFATLETGMVGMNIPSVSLEVTGIITDSTNLAGPGITTPCGEEPPVLIAMRSNMTLAYEAQAQMLVSGPYCPLPGHTGCIGLHEPAAYMW